VRRPTWRPAPNLLGDSDGLRLVDIDERNRGAFLGRLVRRCRADSARASVLLLAGAQKRLA
ncbi:hypothetical protein, partial [Mycobacterium sp.]|uniref:hypothetical protein n=1 Tax=Mycobacterium sp. TaxID=1785 RepID=UPI002C6F1F19